MSATIWHYCENQFDNATNESRKRMNTILSDHIAKLVARASEHATIGALVGPTQAVVNSWNLRYTDWRNKRASYRSASKGVQDLLDALMFSPGNGLRSKIDEWDTKLSALWVPGSQGYLEFLPNGRAPFTTGGRDNIIKEVDDFSKRLVNSLGALVNARDAVQATVDAVTSGGGSPSGELLEQLETASARLSTVQSLTQRVGSFSNDLSAARLLQQGKEGLVDGAATLAEEQRIVSARRMYANLGILMAHFVLLPGEQAEPQCAAGDFYDLDTLIETGEDEEPDPVPAPVPVPVP